MPHIHCYLDRSGLVWSMFATDMLIGIAYVGISLTLWELVKKIKLRFNLVVVCFGVFILACGLTHFMEVWTLWHPDYWLAAVIKGITAAASIGTGIYLFQLRHAIIQVAEAAKLSEQRRLDLEILLEQSRAALQHTAGNERKNFRNLFRQTPEMVCITSGPEHVFEFVNEAHVKALGFDATGKSVREAQPESVEVHGILDNVYRTGVTAELNEIPVTLTGRLRYFNLTYAARRDIHNEINGIMILGVEVTDQVLTREALQEAVRARDEFMSIASHELKTPLTSLQLQSQIRQRDLSRDEVPDYTRDKLQQMFDADTRHIRRITRLIDDMLDISRLSTGRFVLNRDRFDLCEMVRETVDRFASQIQTAQGEVQVDLCESVTGEWDRFRMEQVLTNLITNAMKYGRGKPIHIRVEKRGGFARFSVRDEGIGIAKENFERIFHRFERAISPNDVSGLGLGLYIAHQIVEMHGGRIQVDSEVGQGSTFTVELPAF